MADDIRLDPDKLLKAIKNESKNANLGQLRVFLGMSAGVGKTYAMLREAQARLREGVDVVIGVVETHGRADTEAMQAHIPFIPKRRYPTATLRSRRWISTRF